MLFVILRPIYVQSVKAITIISYQICQTSSYITGPTPGLDEACRTRPEEI